MKLARFEEDRPAWWKLLQVVIELFALWSCGAWFDPIAQMPLRGAWRRLVAKKALSATAPEDAGGP